MIVQVGGQAGANLCGPSCSVVLCAGAAWSGWFSEQVMVRHDDPVGKIHRLFSCWSWLQLWSFSQALVCHWKARMLLFHWLPFGNNGNAGLVPSHHPLGAGRVVLGRDGSSRYSLPPQAAEGIRSFICTQGETEITKKSVDKVIEFHWLYSRAIGWFHRNGIP